MTEIGQNSAAVLAPSERGRRFGWARTTLARLGGVTLAVLVVGTYFAIRTNGQLLIGSNILTILRGLSTIAIMGFGLTVVIIAAEIDLSFAAVYGLAQVMPAWAAFLVVAGVYLLVAALLGFLALRRFRALKGPERAIAEAKETRDLLVEHNGRANAHTSGLTAADMVDIRAEAATTLHAYETPPTPS